VNRFFTVFALRLSHLDFIAIRQQLIKYTLLEKKTQFGKFQ